MFSDPIFISLTFLACMGLLYCSSILINALGSTSMKYSAFFIAFLFISSFVYLNYEAVSNFTESQQATNEQLNNFTTTDRSASTILVRSSSFFHCSYLFLL